MISLALEKIANNSSVDNDTVPCFETKSSFKFLENVTAGEINQIIDGNSENKAT